MLFQRGTGEGAGFRKIQPPHTPLRLRELCGQAKIYIRPLQKDVVAGGEDVEEVYKLDSKDLLATISITLLVVLFCSCY